MLYVTSCKVLHVSGFLHEVCDFLIFKLKPLSPGENHNASLSYVFIYLFIYVPLIVYSIHMQTHFSYCKFIQGHREAGGNLS